MRGCARLRQLCAAGAALTRVDPRERASSRPCCVWHGHCAAWAAPLGWAAWLQPGRARFAPVRNRRHSTMRPTRAFPLAVLACACAAASASPNVTDQMIQTEAKSGKNVLSWGLSTDGQRYSPLKQVNVANVSRLTPAWAFSFGGE